MTIFDLMESQQLAAYWTELLQDEAPYVGEELFPDNKKRGLDLKWIKGAKGNPVVLKTSAFDVYAVPRPRIGFDKLSAEMPYFKESTYIDEEMRQELNIVLETGNQAYIDAVMTRIFDDEMRLLRGARASRERMRMMALTTGVIAMAANGQQYEFDYGVRHKGNSAADWSDRENADVVEDMRVAKEEIFDNTGEIVTRAMCDNKTWRNIRNNKLIAKTLYPATQGIGPVSESLVRRYILDELGIEILVNEKRYIDEQGNTMKFMPEDTFVMFPEGRLGETWFGTTPAESDLMASQVSNVSIVDTGVAILTKELSDPVTTETIVSMICLPSFEAADNIYIMDTTGGDA